jgi:hypothetical protein
MSQKKMLFVITNVLINEQSTECFIDLGKLNQLKISLPWAKSVKLTVHINEQNFKSNRSF